MGELKSFDWEAGQEGRILTCSCAECWPERTLSALRGLGLGRRKGFGGRCISGEPVTKTCHSYRIQRFKRL